MKEDSDEGEQQETQDNTQFTSVVFANAQPFLPLKTHEVNWFKMYLDVHVYVHYVHLSFGLAVSYTKMLQTIRKFRIGFYISDYFLSFFKRTAKDLRTDFSIFSLT